MKEIESKVSSLSSLQPNGLLFADDFVGLSDSKECLQDMIHCKCCSCMHIARSGALKQM